MEEFVLAVLSSTAASTILVGGLAWLNRSWLSERLKQSIQAEYSQKLETHKAQLKGQNALEMERLRASLRVAAAERSVKFSRLHEKRADVVAETYRLLHETYTAVCDYTKVFEPAGGAPRDERRRTAAAAHEELRKYYPPKLIFLPEALAAQVEHIDRELVSSFNRFAIMVEGDGAENRTREWFEVSSHLQNEIKETLAQLANEFRSALGDESVVEGDEEPEAADR